jgi:2-haloalkanoic acid dehalogenase type II
MAALPLIVFDVNEALLDLQTMEPIFQRIFGDKGAMRLWFANFIMYSAALTVAGCYVPFTDIGSAVMRMLADIQGIEIDDADKEELKEKFSTMPPHRDVPSGLRKLRDAGFRLFTLTDNLLEVQTRQLEHGGIVDLFERRFGADRVKHHKPPSSVGRCARPPHVRPPKTSFEALSLCPLRALCGLRGETRSRSRHRPCQFNSVEAALRVNVRVSCYKSPTAEHAEHREEPPCVFYQ